MLFEDIIAQIEAIFVCVQKTVSALPRNLLLMVTSFHSKSKIDRFAVPLSVMTAADRFLEIAQFSSGLEFSEAVVFAFELLTFRL